MRLLGFWYVTGYIWRDVFTMQPASRTHGVCRTLIYTFVLTVRHFILRHCWTACLDIDSPSFYIKIIPDREQGTNCEYTTDSHLVYVCGVNDCAACISTVAIHTLIIDMLVQSRGPEWNRASHNVNCVVININVFFVMSSPTASNIQNAAIESCYRST